MTIEHIKTLASYQPLKSNGFTDTNIIIYLGLSSIGERKIFFENIKNGVLNVPKVKAKVNVQKEINPPSKVVEYGVKEIRVMANEMMSKTFTINGKDFVMSKLGWKFSFNNNKSRLGLCRGCSKEIHLSRWIIENSKKNEKLWVDTMLHEIAHAIDFEIRGTSDHSNRWRRIALTIGCDGNRCGSVKVDPKASKYTLKCVNCKVEKVSHKRKKRKSACRACCDNYNNGYYSEKYVMEQIQNY